MTRRPIIIGAQKLYLDLKAAVAFAADLSRTLRGHSFSFDVGVAPSFINLAGVAHALANSPVKLGAQNVHQEEDGAFTGQVSLRELKPLGVSFVIVGHSELRAQQRESNEEVNRKIKLCLKHGVVPVACVGEQREDRHAARSKEVIRSHLVQMLSGVRLSEDNADKFVIAYEPVWAIRAGKEDLHTKPATPAEAGEMHEFIRQVIAELYDKSIAQVVRVIYGGSVNRDNAADFAKTESIDGLLVGTSSVELASFIGVLDASERAFTLRNPGKPHHPATLAQRSALAKSVARRG